MYQSLGTFDYNNTPSTFSTQHHCLLLTLLAIIALLDPLCECLSVKASFPVVGLGCRGVKMIDDGGKTS